MIWSLLINLKPDTLRCAGVIYAALRSPTSFNSVSLYCELLTAEGYQVDFLPLVLGTQVSGSGVITHCNGCTTSLSNNQLSLSLATSFCFSCS